MSEEHGYFWMCVVEELRRVSVQGCAQDCYVKEVNLPFDSQRSRRPF